MFTVRSIMISVGRSIIIVNSVNIISTERNIPNRRVPELPVQFYVENLISFEKSRLFTRVLF